MLLIMTNKNKYYIPSISKSLLKFQGGLSQTLSDKYQVDNLSLSVKMGLTLINNSKHKHVIKLWILQHPPMPQLCWPLLIYEIPTTAVVKLEQKIFNSTCKWLCLHNSTTKICLCSNLLICPLPTKGLTSNLKSANVSGKLLLHESVILLQPHYQTTGLLWMLYTRV